MNSSAYKDNRLVKNITGFGQEPDRHSSHIQSLSLVAHECLLSEVPGLCGLPERHSLAGKSNTGPSAWNKCLRMPSSGTGDSLVVRLQEFWADCSHALGSSAGTTPSGGRARVSLIWRSLDHYFEVSPNP